MTNTNESGRSMVEMLGVLAIIGVLSVMGIAGYTQAMKKYRANEAVSEITMGAMLCATQGNLSGMSFSYIESTSCSGDTLNYSLKAGVEESFVSDMLNGRGDFSNGQFNLMAS